MRYKARQVILRRTLAARGVSDLSYLPLTQKLEIFASLGISFGPRNLAL